MIRLIPLICFLILFKSPILQAQSLVLGGQKNLDFKTNDLLANKFSAFDVFYIDSKSLSQSLTSRGFNKELFLDLGVALKGNVHIESYNMKSQDHVLLKEVNGKIEKTKERESFNYRGHFWDDPEDVFSLTVTDNFIFGFFIKDDEHWMIEPVSNFGDNLAPDTYVVYNAKNVKYTTEHKCGVETTSEKLDQSVEQRNLLLGTNNCTYQIELAIASDWTMSQNKGGTANTNTFVDAVMNNVQLLYDTEFQDSLKFVIVAHYVSSSASDGLERTITSSNDANTILSNFSDWGEAGNFGVTFDLGQFWTKRDFAGSTIGLAYVGAICTSSKYHVLQEWSGNNTNYTLQVMAAHEIGHNLNLSHDVSSGFIMSPSVASTSTWSPVSLSTLNSFYISLTCLQPIDTRLKLGTPTKAAYEASNSGTAAANCGMKYTLVTIPVQLYRTIATSSVTATLSIDGASTALQNRDYSIVSGTVTFAAGSTNASSNFNLAIFEDAIDESVENIILNLSVGANLVCSTDNINVSISDNDFDPSIATNRTIVYGAGDSNVNYYPFGGIYTDARARVIYTAADLTGFGLKKGYINSIAFNVISKNSTQAYSNFNISAKNTSVTTPSYTETGLTSLVNNASVSVVSGWNTFNISSPYYWDGSSNILFEFCFNNTSSSNSDVISSTSKSSNVAMFNISSTGSDNGCSLAGFYSETEQPDLRFNYTPIMDASNATNKSAVSYLTTGDIAFFYDDQDKALVKIQQTGGTNLECVNVSIDRAGSSALTSPTWLDPTATSKISQKTFYITSTNNGNYDITLIYKASEISALGGTASSYKMIKTPNKIQNTTTSVGAQLVVPTYGTFTSDGVTFHTYTSSFATFSGFAVTSYTGALLPLNLISFKALKNENAVDLLWETSNEINLKEFIIERSANGQDFYPILTKEPTGQGAQLSKYSSKDQQPLSGVSYYRLKSVSLDQKSEYSKIVQVVFGKKSSISLYPNPVTNNKLYIVSTGSSSINEVQVIDSKGTVIKAFKFYADLNSGSQSIEMDLNELPIGNYVIRTLGNSQTEVFKIQKL